MSGATAVAVAGLLVLVVDHDAAIEPATSQYGERFNGLGGNPNAAATLEALALPLALAAAIAEAGAEARSAGGRSWRYLRLHCGSGSRGGILAAAVGSLVTVVAGVRPQRRVLAAGAVASPRSCRSSCRRCRIRPLSASPPPADRKPPPSLSAPNPFDVQQQRLLQDDIGRNTAESRRTLFGTGGRRRRCGAMEQVVLERPLLGYGFGFEEHVFADRYAVFNAQRPENAYVGTALQIGLFGLALLIALIASPRPCGLTADGSGRRAVRGRRPRGARGRPRSIVRACRR